MSDLNLIETLKKEVQAKLNWGESKNWSGYDFEKLSEMINDTTNVSLSVSTLKRLFGKVSYKNSPSISTLNSISKFLGYVDWRHFSTEKSNGGSNIQLPSITLHTDSSINNDSKFQKPNIKRFMLYACSAIVIIMLIFLFLKIFNIENKYNTADFTFNSSKILSQGVPNSVIFNYDARKVNPKDSVFISQTWDINRKFNVSPLDTQHTAIYYYPGYFRAKLLIGNTIIKEHDLNIITDGWLGLTYKKDDEEPIYFLKEDIQNSQEISIKKDLLAKYGINDLYNNFNLFNQKAETGLFTDDFIFETDIKLDSVQQPKKCFRFEAIIHSKNDVLVMPLVSPPCVGDVNLIAFGYSASSKSNNLSMFGRDFNNWTKIGIFSTGGKINFVINNELIFSSIIANMPTEIVGIQFRFNCFPIIRNTRIKNKNIHIEF